ncbi:MAG TPA: Ig-like domain-containing protein, partial [Gaiellaceae bacterium]|nr:Ig-like domain-containing protein [Gaiellaceae bacterium]
ISLDSPQSYTFARGVVTISATSSSSADPASVTYDLDGAPVSSPWDTTATADGSHTVTATITDGRGKTATDSAPVTVDNTPPSISILSPAPGSTFPASLAAQASVSDAHGVGNVQFTIDGAAAGPVLTAADADNPYTYSTTLDVSALALGAHTLGVAATDTAGNSTSSAPLAFDVGPLPLEVALTVPPDWTFAHGGAGSALAEVSGGTAPFSVQLLVDGKAVGAPVSAEPYTLPWDTTTITDGTHLVSARVTDAAGLISTSPALHISVDNTPPEAWIAAPAAGVLSDGPLELQAHASDAYGVASVQFTVDGTPVGDIVTAPLTGQLYLYGTTFDTSTLTSGTHLIAAIVTDAAGNTTTVAPVSIHAGTPEYLPVLNYHEIAPPDGYSIYDQTPAEADAQLAYLKENGYQSVTLAQYQAWLAGTDIGVAKPVLITVDDGTNDEAAWDGLLQKYGFTGVMFIVTGFADGKTPGSTPTDYLSWAQIQALAANGRWEIALHAGQYGHGDSYGPKLGIDKQTSYTTACPYFYSCLSEVTTTAKKKRGHKRVTTVTPQTPAAFETAVANEIAQGMARLRQMVPNTSTLAWAAPFNDAGQWTNLYNDPSGQVQAWLPGFLASQFPIVFTQTSPVTYGQASGTVGALDGFNRHYRFEVHTDTTIQQFAATLSDSAFVR